MAWNQNKPLAGDLLSQSQADLQGNFQALNGMLDPINPTLKLTSIAQTPVGPNQLNMFVQLDPTTGNTPQLFVQRETGSVDTPTLLNFTGSNKTAASGWTYLPSGLELFWGTGVGGTAVAFADGGFDNNCFSVSVTPNTPAPQHNWISVTGLNQTGFTANTQDGNGNPSNQPFYYIAIGY